MWFKRMIKAVMAVVLRIFCRRRAIVFESTPDFADNTYAVFEEMIRLGLGNRYQMVWSCSQKDPIPGPYPNVKYIYPLDKSLKQRLRNAYYLANANCMICCNRFLEPWLKKRQTAFYLTHGTPIKSISSYYNMPATIQHCLAASQHQVEVTARELKVDESKMFALGYPRNDVLTKKPACNVKQMLKTPCSKVIVWYPTFRQHQEKSGISFGNAMPIIHDTEAAVQLNKWAQEMNVLLVMKPHFAQDLKYVKDLELSNLCFIDDAFFRERNTTSYAFVAGCDALLTDYSSIYYDYLLCDKPVGLIWEDINQYRAKPGFAVDTEQIAKGASVIYDLEEFKEFIRQVAYGEDPHRQARNALCDLANYSRDGRNSRRVAMYIFEKAKL